MISKLKYVAVVKFEQDLDIQKHKLAYVANNEITLWSTLCKWCQQLIEWLVYLPYSY